MSSSFKRRIPSKTSSLPSGVRASPSSSTTSSSLPLFSTGLTAIDDLISGRGQPSSSSLLLIPSTNTATSLTKDSDSSDHLSRAASEPYTELILAYGVAQAINAKQKVVLVGTDLQSFTTGLMGKIGQEEEDEELRKKEKEKQRERERKASGEADEEEEEEDDDEEDNAKQSLLNSKGEKMDIAWRYEKMKQFKTSIDSSQAGKGGE